MDIVHQVESRHSRAAAARIVHAARTFSPDLALPAVADRRRPIELSLERSLPGPAGTPPVVVRVSVRLDDDADPSEAALADEVRRLDARLQTAVRVVRPDVDRPDRPLAELIETYRPRQPELLDLLREEGELSPTEYSTLRGHLDAAAPARPAAGGVPITDRPIAAAPLESDRAPATPRPVEELLRTYQIASLKQAGAVRARRQISFEEYMALKRHFGTAPAESSPPAAP
jgi:hypothetical protein